MSMPFVAPDVAGASSAADAGFAAFAVTEESVIDSLCRKACRDEVLLGVADEAEIVQAVEQSVHALWAGSRVKTFVSVLAMRDVQSLVDRRRQGSEVSGMSTVARAGSQLRRTDDDILTLRDGGHAG